jgi:hypothetical protein
MPDLYRVKNWDRHFEGAKSKTYNNKTSCSLPTKHGLSYKRLIRSEDGTSLFGAWCALIQVLSRHEKPRQGYCTDTGKSNGIPYTPDDLEMLTDIPAKYFSKMLCVCSSQSVGWIALVKDKDTTGDHEGTMVPLNSDSDSDLNYDSNTQDVADFPPIPENAGTKELDDAQKAGRFKDIYLWLISRCDMLDEKYFQYESFLEFKRMYQVAPLWYVVHKLPPKLAGVKLDNRRRTTGYVRTVWGAIDAEERKRVKR